MKKFANLASAVAVAALVATSAAVPSANAMECTRCKSASVSQPFVEEVVTSGKSFTAYVSVCGQDRVVKKAKVQVINRRSGKRVRCDRLGVHSWAFRGKKGNGYKIVVRGSKGERKAIGYRVY